MEKANGQMLFRYRATQTEYQELKALFASRFAALAGSPWRFDSHAEAALFVLYASEWWRREYAGGAWRWTSIFESLTNGPYRVDQLERSVIVDLGLRVWGHRPGDDGHRYLGAIVAHGGFPLQMVARGDGVVTRLLLSATRKAQMVGWGEPQLIGYFDSHRDELVQHLRASEIYRLLSEMVLTVLTLRGEYKLAGVANPVAVLEQMDPKWRERFPIAVDDQSVDSLLVGLVREVSRHVRTGNAYPVSVARTLVQLAEAKSYALSMAVSVPSSISVDALASAMQIPLSKVPPSFVLEMAGEHRKQLGQGRVLLGEQSSTVLLTGSSKRFLGKDACQEVLLALRSVGSDIVSPTSVPGGEAMDQSQPWIFAPIEGTLTLMGVGSTKVASDMAYLLVPDRFRLVPEEGSFVELVGLIEELPEPRWMHKVQGKVSIIDEDDIFFVRTHAQSDAYEQFVWKGSRLWCHSSPFPVYQGVPRLFRLDDDGQMLPVADKEIEWVQAVRKGEKLLNVKAHRGPVDAWWIVDGKRQRRFRMTLVAPDAHISFMSGSTEFEGTIAFHGWGVSALHTSVELSAVYSGSGALSNLEMRAKNRPPANVIVTAEWSPNLPVLHIELPFPATGGRFARTDGSVVPNGASLTLKRAHDLHVQVFDQNPSAPRRYRLELQLLGESQGNRLRRAEVGVPLDANGVGDLRFFEIESTLNGLFCQSDHLDACMEVKLLAGSASIRILRINRYDVDLEREQQSLVLPSSQVANLLPDQLQGIDLLAIPLLEKGIEPQRLEQLKSDQQPVGRWSMVALPLGRSPWLIFPSNTSALLARPTLWSASAFDRLGTLKSLGNEACPLAMAMSSSTTEDRSRDLTKVIAAMVEDLEHPSWNLVFHHYKYLKHLPLNTLDYWRLIGRNQDACLAAVLKLPADLHELMSRMRDELGVLWEFTSRESLLRAYEALSRSLNSQLGGGATPELIVQIANGVFEQMSFAAESLGIQIDRILFEKSGVRGERFERLISDLKCSPSVLLQQLLHGESSHLQRVLLRNHADERVWPFFKLWEELLGEISSQGNRQQVEFVSGLGRQLLWMPQMPLSGPQVNVKLDVANAPLLIGFLIHICDVNKWLHTSDHLAALRQIKVFDPTWFDLGIQMGALLAIKSREQPTKARRPK